MAQKQFDGRALHGKIGPFRIPQGLALKTTAVRLAGWIRGGGISLVVALSSFGIVGCSEEPEVTSTDSLPDRWFTAEQVARGADVFEANCASCHGAGAVGDPNWRQRGTDGLYPPPPLNGSAHAWHHPLVWLEATITKGGGAQGRMPAWGGQLSPDEIKATIAWFQSLWPEEIYAIWAEGNARYEANNGG